MSNASEKAQRWLGYTRNPNAIFGIIYDKSLLPYLIHFGEKGITPEVFWVFQREQIGGRLSVVFKKINGPRLGAWLNGNTDLKLLMELYEELGYRFGYMHKYNVFHNHSKISNLIVDENNKPVVVDWKHGSVGAYGIYRFPSYEAWYPDTEQASSRDSGLLLTYANRILSAKIYKGSIEALERVFHERRQRELTSPLEVAVEEIERQAQEFLLAHSN